MVSRLPDVTSVLHDADGEPMLQQRESSASIKASPAKYEQNSPAKAKNIIAIDCRGLEFTDFKADV